MQDSFSKLTVISGPEEGQILSLQKHGLFKVGRSEDNDLVLKDSSVSRHHFSIAVEDDNHFIVDEGSSNGTLLAGKKLKTGQRIPLKHEDEIEVGLYRLQYSFTEGAPKPKTKPPVDPLNTQAQDSLPDSQPISDPQTTPEAEAVPQVEKPQNQASKKTALSLALVGILVLGSLVGYVYWQKKRSIEPLPPFDPSQQSQSAEDKTETPSIVNADPSITKEQAEASPNVATAQDTPKATSVEPEIQTNNVQNTAPTAQNMSQISVVLDVNTAPFFASIYLGNERLGRAPFKRPVTVKVGEPIEVHADYELFDVNDIYRETKVITPKLSDDVISVQFNAKLAEVDVVNLPRRAEFSWRGYYDHDQTRSFPVNISRISYGRPIYLPYGQYTLELREEATVPGSQQNVSKVTYQRQYVLNSQSPSLQISVTDEDLKKFPVVIRSAPDGASVYRFDEKLGVTPYTGFLPVGSNPLKIRKDGFFEESLVVDMPMNSPYEAKVDLKTSKMGEYILQAKERRHVNQNEEAIQLLIEALKYGGTDSEKAQVYYLLGEIYFEKADYDTAHSYFSRAEQSQDWTHKAKLAIAQVFHKQGQTQSAISEIAEVMAYLEGQESSSLQQEANSVFKRVSPVQSAIYIYTEPSDALVFVNDKLIDKASPVLLSGLGLGNYRIRIEKNGYEVYTTRHSLKISEFLMVKVKLEKKEL